MTTRRNACVVAAILLCISTTQAATIFVDIANCPGPGDGSVGDPYCSIQTAIDNAVDTDEIVVAPGTYFESINFLGKAVTLRSSDGPAATIIDATGFFHVVQCVSGERPDTVLDGFTITGGNANSPFPDNFGGGMYNDASSPTVTNCTFSGNTAVTGGGGMANDIFSSPTVSNCTFSGNTANFGSGGGMHNVFFSSPTVTDCVFSGNTADGSFGGGGMYSDDNSFVVAINCTFSGNTATSAFGVGGGMRNRNNNATVTDCTFDGNTAEREGGGMHNSGGFVTVTNCTFSGNSANGFLGGGGMYNGRQTILTVTNCTFSGNVAGGGPGESFGGGMVNFLSFSSFTISDCTFSGNSAWSGGGMYNTFTSATITNCTFSENSAQFGGGMYNDGGNAIVTNCTFSGNLATAVGGGMVNDIASATTTNCTYSGNSAADGGGMWNKNSSPTVTNCSFIGNTDGGGMSNVVGSNPTVTNCTFSGNTAFSGSGMSNVVGSNPTVTNCTFTGNTATGPKLGGGGMLNSQSNPTVTNCTFSGNSAGIWGGGLSSTLNSFPTITNCTFSGNTAPVGGGIYTTDAIGGFSVTVVVNTISWGNNPDQIGDEGGATTTVNYSDVQGGWSGAGSNNIDADPLFVDPNNGDYHLLPSSPCIDAGDNTAVPPGIDTDIDGNPRVLNGQVDMGADEVKFAEVTVAPGAESEPIVPSGADPPDYAQHSVVVFQNNSADPAQVMATEVDAVLNETNTFSAFGVNLRITTDVPNGAFIMTVSVPFTGQDLLDAGLTSSPGDLAKINLRFWDGTDWVPAGTNCVDPVVDTDGVTDPPPSNAPLGACGVYFNSHKDLNAGYAWAVVDHATDFAAGVPACPWDCADGGNGDVGITDFLKLLADWSLPSTCDFDGGGVGINDFLELLANWGPCP